MDKLMIKTVSEKVCSIEMNGQAIEFDRYCPHSGADLSKVGYYDEQTQTIRCGWHNLSFDLETGQSPCGSINCKKN